MPMTGPRPRLAAEPRSPPLPATSRSWGRILAYASWLAGSALLTAGVAALTSPWVWAISGGLVMLGGVGLRATGLAIWRGIYFLTGRAE